MPTVYRATATWSGFQGAPGYSKFSFLDLTDDAARNGAGAAIRAYFNSQVSYINSPWSILVSPIIQEFDAASGDLTGETTMSTAPLVLQGGATATTWVAGAGYFVGWRTASFFLGRKIQGRTFHVPAINCYEADGSLTSAAITAAQTAANTLVALSIPNLAVWARQWTKPTDGSKPVQIGGTVVPVTSALVKDQVSTLRSRRT